MPITRLQPNVGFLDQEVDFHLRSWSGQQAFHLTALAYFLYTEPKPGKTAEPKQM